MKKHTNKKPHLIKTRLEMDYYSKCGRIIKSFISSKSEKRMYNALKKLNEIGKDYVEQLNKISLNGSLPKWENLILAK